MNQIYEYSLTFTKLGILKYISHLDLLRLFQRVLRRAGIPVLFSQGYHPIAKIRFKRALKLGIESKAEELYLKLLKPLPEDELIQRLNTQLPSGIQIISASKI